jgi:hypothetical protein
VTFLTEEDGVPEMLALAKAEPRFAAELDEARRDLINCGDSAASLPL